MKCEGATSPGYCRTGADDVAMINYIEGCCSDAGGKTISVVILTNHSMEIVNRLIDRLLPQLSPDRHELVFLDNNSTDGTVEYLKSIPFSNKKVLTVEEGTFSHSRTRMWGADNCSGDIIVFFTDDIIPITDNFLEELVRPVEEGRAAAACGAYQIDPGTGDPLRALRYNDWYMTHPEIVLPISQHDWDDLTPFARRKLCTFDNCAACYDRKLLLHFRFPDLPYGEDMGIAKELLLRGYPIATSKRARFYHWHNVSFSYFLKRMCIDQIVTVRLFDWINVTSKPRLLFRTGAQIGFYFLLGLHQLRRERIRWILYSWKYIMADNLGMYIGGLDPVRISKGNFIDRYLLRKKEKLWAEVSSNSIIRNKS
jgi:rhamnosyltransferase